MGGVTLLPFFYHGRARSRASGVKNAKVRSGIENSMRHGTFNRPWPRVHRESCMLIHGRAYDREMSFGHHCVALRACPSRWYMIFSITARLQSNMLTLPGPFALLFIRELVLEGAMWLENVILRISAGSNT